MESKKLQGSWETGNWMRRKCGMRSRINNRQLRDDRPEDCGVLQSIGSGQDGRYERE